MAGAPQYPSLSRHSLDVAIRDLSPLLMPFVVQDIPCFGGPCGCCGPGIYGGARTRTAPEPRPPKNTSWQDRGRNLPPVPSTTGNGFALPLPSLMLAATAAATSRAEYVPLKLSGQREWSCFTSDPLLTQRHTHRRHMEVFTYDYR
jgi:hypothetical protein